MATVGGIFGNSVMIGQIVNAQDTTEKLTGNVYNNNNTNVSGKISSLQMPIRPPFAASSRAIFTLVVSRCVGQQRPNHEFNSALMWLLL